VTNSRAVAKVQWADIVDSRGEHRTAPMLEAAIGYAVLGTVTFIDRE